MRNFSLNNGWLASLIAMLPGVTEELPEPVTIVPPSPDQVALAFASAMLASGKYGENAQASVIAAWWAVPFFYEGRHEYAEKIGPMFFEGLAASHGLPDTIQELYPSGA